MARLTFSGGIHPYDGKDMSKSKLIKDVDPKGELVYPLSQHIGAPAKPVVAKGDHVLAGQLIAEAGGSKVLVWQTTDPDAELLNSTKLMFSYYDNGVWSEPQCVNQSESADLTARLVENGDDIYLIWQKQNAVIQGGDLSQMAAQALASTDIFTASGTAWLLQTQPAC